MTIKCFEDLIAWQKAQNIAIEIYSLFKDLKDFSFKDQICRASVSISNNIAEGFDRHTKKEFQRFLFIAKGSCAEVKSMLYLAIRLNYIEHKVAQKIQQDCEELAKIMRGLIKSLDENGRK